MLEPGRQLRTTEFLTVKVNQADFRSMFTLAVPEIVQVRAPTLVFRQVVCRSLGKQDVIGVCEDMTRSAMFTPPPATLDLPFTSTSRVTGPL